MTSEHLMRTCMVDGFSRLRLSQRFLGWLIHTYLEACTTFLRRTKTLHSKPLYLIREARIWLGLMAQ